MSLDTIDAKLAKAFNGPLARAIKPFTGSREVAGSYDPVTGTTSTTTATYTGRGSFGDYSAEQVDNQHILGTDQLLTALQMETSGTPQVGDTIEGMEVVRVAQDAASVTWELQLRRT